MFDWLSSRRPSHGAVSGGEQKRRDKTGRPFWELHLYSSFSLSEVLVSANFYKNVLMFRGGLSNGG